MAQLDESLVGDDPIKFFLNWFDDARNSDITEVNAMTLATVDTYNKPKSRIVLLKGVEDNAFIFYTNYNSSKGLDIEINPNVSLVFFWKELERQVRIEGKAVKVAPEVSDEYFQSRPVGSRLGAWSSPQSQKISSREVLNENYKVYEEKYASGDVPRPEHWGGFAVQPEFIEFWQGRSSRMHDRICFEKGVDNKWSTFRLAP